MKKILALSVFLFSLATVSLAQDFRFGLHFSPNISWVKTNSTNLESNGSGVNFGYGLIAEFNLGDRYAVATGLTVQENSLKIKYTDDVISYTTDLKMRYIEIPVALKLKTNEIGAFTYFGKFGLTPQFRIKSQGETSIQPEPGKANFNKYTFPIRTGLIFGFGTEYNISGDTRILLGLDFNNGFMNIFQKDAFGEPSEKPKANSSYVALTLGVMF